MQAHPNASRRVVQPAEYVSNLHPDLSEGKGQLSQDQ